MVKISSALVVLLTFMAYVCPHVNPVGFSWMAFFGTAFPWLLLANAVLAALWAWRLNRFALYHVGVILVGWQYVSGFIGFDFEKDKIPESAITVATHNLGRLWGGQKVTDERREKVATAYTKFLQENGSPDILCAQETGGKFYRLLAQKMGYTHTFNLQKGTVILSRFPVEAGADIPLGKTANSSIWADVRINGRLVRVYCVHLQSNKVTATTEKVIQEAELDEEETWQDISSVLGKVGSATRVRAEQAQRLREHIEACPHPVIVCGDFNDTPNSYVYARLSEGLNDTFRDKGLGFGTTFGGALPMLRIDYILTDRDIKTYSCRTVRDGGFSDHYPVFVTVGVRP